MKKKSCANNKKPCRNKNKCDNQQCENLSATPIVVDAVATAPPMAALDAVTKTITEPPASEQPAPGSVITDPAAVITTSSTNFKQAYDQYVALRELARPLNGLAQSADMPAGVTVSNVRIDFTVGDKSFSADVPNVKLIGALSPLIAVGLRSLLERMHEELFSLEHVTQGMQKVVAAAFSNKSSVPASTTVQKTTTVLPVKVNTVNSPITLSKQ